jgi:hypothetical protein
VAVIAAEEHILMYGDRRVAPEQSCSLLTEASSGANIAGVVYRKIRDGAEPARLGTMKTRLGQFSLGFSESAIPLPTIGG